MLERVLHHLQTPNTAAGPLLVVESAPVERTPAIGLTTAVLAGPDGQDPSAVELGVWHALGRRRAPVTPTQLINSALPIPEVYEAVWRPRKLALLSGRPYSVAGEIDEIVHAIGDPNGAFVIDIGCAEGLYARHLARRGALVAAIDHSRPFLRRALLRAAQGGVTIAAIRALAENLPVGDAQADAVVIGGTANQLADRSKVLDESARVLRPGGRLFLSAPVTSGRRSRLWVAGGALGGWHLPTADALTDECTRAGLTVIDRRVDAMLCRITAELGQRADQPTTT